VTPQGEPGHVGSHRRCCAALALLRVEGAIGVDGQLEPTTKADTGAGEHLVRGVPAMGGQSANASPGGLLRGLVHAYRLGAYGADKSALVAQ
jgi:hypothetical protein